MDIDLQQASDILHGGLCLACKERLPLGRVLTDRWQFPLLDSIPALDLSNDIAVISAFYHHYVYAEKYRVTKDVIVWPGFEISSVFLQLHPEIIGVVGCDTLGYLDFPGSIGVDNVVGFHNRSVDGIAYTVTEYTSIYKSQVDALYMSIGHMNDKTFMISKFVKPEFDIHAIWDNVVCKYIKKDLKEFNNRIIWLF